MPFAQPVLSLHSIFTMLNVATREEKECSGPLLNYLTKVCLIDNRKTYLNGNLWEPSREFLRERLRILYYFIHPFPPPPLPFANLQNLF